MFSGIVAAVGRIEHIEPLADGIRLTVDTNGLDLADVTANSEEHKALLKRFGLFGPPGIIFFDAAGKEREGMRVVGFMKATPFATVLDRAL